MNGVRAWPERFYFCYFFFLKVSEEKNYLLFKYIFMYKMEIRQRGGGEGTGAHPRRDGEGEEKKGEGEK